VLFDFRAAGLLTRRDHRLAHPGAVGPETHRAQVMA